MRSRFDSIIAMAWIAAVGSVFGFLGGVIADTPARTQSDGLASSKGQPAHAVSCAATVAFRTALPRSLTE
jgi:hypothetical protein